MSQEEVRAKAASIAWWHPIDLGGGFVTPGKCTSAPVTLAKLALGDLTGKTVLDVGAWDGFYSFAAERAGASRVLATDSFVWQDQTWGSKHGFLLARDALGSCVTDMTIDVMHLDPEKIGRFDVVLFLGVLYHLRHPLLGLEKVAACTKPGGLVFIESHVEPNLHPSGPACAFFPGSELGGDASNWWGPNPKALVALAESAGLKVLKMIDGAGPTRRIVCAQRMQ